MLGEINFAVLNAFNFLETRSMQQLLLRPLLFKKNKKPQAVEDKIS